MAYQHVKNPMTGNTGECIKYTDTTNIVSFIPVDPANRDYQTYLEWVDAGNTATAAD